MQSMGSCGKDYEGILCTTLRSETWDVIQNSSANVFFPAAKG